MIYLDYAATTPVRDEVRQKVDELLGYCYGNPSAIYSVGRQSAGELKKARRLIAESVNVSEKNIVFTSGATESNNHVIFSIVQLFRNKHKIPHIITSPLEHPSILEPLRFLEKDNQISLSVLPVDSNGIIDHETLRRIFKKETVLVSVCAVASETGTVQNIREISSICKEAGIYFHSDFSQAIRSSSIRNQIASCDIVSLSSHKIYGLKGIGLIIANKTIISSGLIMGGSQERGLRAGTENVPAAAGLSVALHCLIDDTDEFKVKSMRDKLHELLTEKSDRFKELCGSNIRADSFLSYIIKGVKAERLLIALDMRGVCVSSGNACAVGSQKPSDALMSMGYDADETMNMLRITIGRYNTKEEIFTASEIIAETVNKLADGKNLNE